MFFFMTESGLTVDKAEVRLDCATYENGKINWTVCNNETCFMLNCKYGNVAVKIVQVKK